MLEAAIERLLVRQNRIVIQVGEHQAKGQFLEMTRGLLESGLLKPSALELDKRLAFWTRRRWNGSRSSARSTG